MATLTLIADDIIVYLETPREKNSIQLAFPMHVFQIQEFIQLWIKNIYLKKQLQKVPKLKFQSYLVLANIYVSFTLY